MKPFCKLIPSHIRDATDFLNKLEKPTPEEIPDTLLVTCDVTNMYNINNIKPELGITAVKYWLDKHPELIHPRFSSDFILEALEFVLKNSNFQFNGHYYSQISGTVTGTKVAPVYANLTMGYLETILYEKVGNHYGSNIRNYVMIHWKRFLDDGFILWKKSFGKFEGFINILNSLDSHIQFTYECSEGGLSFLNVFVYIEQGKLLTDVFYKQTDSHDYMHFNSCHPRHTKNNIPRTLARIVCTIVDDPTRRHFRLEELKQWLSKKGYPSSLVKNAFSKVTCMDQQLLRATKPPKNDDLLVYLQINNPNNPNVFGYIRDYVSFLGKSKKYQNIFGGVKVIKSEKQPPNLQKLLVKSNILRENLNAQVTKCGRSNCGTCRHILETDTVNFHRVNVDFKIKTSFCCYSKDLIYKITCSGCSEYYIGLTVNLRQRVSNHKFSLFNHASRYQKVHKHIHECASEHDLPFTIVPFYKVHNATLTIHVSH